MNNSFYTIMIDNKYLPANRFKDYTNNIIEAIKFEDEKEAKEYFELLRKDKPFVIAYVRCNTEVIKL